MCKVMLQGLVAFLSNPPAVHCWEDNSISAQVFKPLPCHTAKLSNSRDYPVYSNGSEAFLN